jgi:ATP synthase protein I
MTYNKAAKKIILIQVIVTLSASMACFVLAHAKAAYSAGIGGGISIIVTAYFARQVFSLGAGASAARIARMFYIGEVIKIALTAVLFGVAIVWLDVSFLPLFLTYAATLLAYWLVLLPFTLDASMRTL